MIEALLILIVPVMFFVLHQFVFIRDTSRKDQDLAISWLSYRGLKCAGNTCPVIGDLRSLHLMKTKEGWSFFDGHELLICAPNAKLSLIHRWKQKKLERLADEYYERSVE